MSIKKFAKKYLTDGNKINQVSLKWEYETKVNDILGFSIAPNLVMADILLGNGLIDTKLDSNLVQAFTFIRSSNFTTQDELKDHLIRNLIKGDESIHGTINQLQGYVAEVKFSNLSNGSISLASSPNQELVDAVRETENGTEFIQIKVYSDADKVIEKIQETNNKLDNDQFFWGNADGSTIEITDYPTFAVNDEVYNEVKNKALKLGLTNNVESLGLSRVDIRDSINGELLDIKSEFFESIASPVIISTAVQAFFQWYCFRDLELVLRSLPKNVAISTVGTLGAVAGRSLALEGLILAEMEFLAIVASPILGVSLAILTKGISTRIIERVDFAEKLKASNDNFTKKLKLIG